jgi:hypothetical protein
VSAILQQIDVDQPEATGEKYTLARRHAVRRILGIVAPYESIDEQFTLDPRDSTHDAWIGDGKKSNAGQKQQASIEFLRSVRPDETAPFGIKAMRADVLVNEFAHFAPPIERPSWPKASAFLMTRSTATHAMTFE